MKKLIALIASLALAAAAILWFFGQGPDDDFAQIFGLCEAIPTDAETVEAMQSIGWQPLPDARLDVAYDATAFFHVATRRTGTDSFDAGAERATFDGRRADAVENIARDGVQAFGRDADGAIAVIGPVDGMPQATGCDLFLPASASTAGFDAAIADFDPVIWTNGWATWRYNDTNGPRPGIWAANLTTIQAGDPEIADFLGSTPPFAILSRTSFRGELPQ